MLESAEEFLSAGQRQWWPTDVSTKFTNSLAGVFNFIPTRRSVDFFFENFNKPMFMRLLIIVFTLIKNYSKLISRYLGKHYEIVFGCRARHTNRSWQQGSAVRT